MTMDQNQAQPEPPAAKQPGKTGIIVGIVLLIAAPIILGAAIFAFVSGVSGTTTYISDTVPAEVDLKEGDQTGIWIEQNGSGYCQVFDPMMLPIAIETSGFASQTVNEYELAAVFLPNQDGTYTVICSGNLIPFHFRVAATGHVASFAIGLTIGIIMIPAGIILLIVTVLRRSAWKNNNSHQPAQQIWQPQPAQPMYEPPQQSSYGPVPSQPAYGSPPQPDSAAPSQPGQGTPAQTNDGTPPQQSQYAPQPVYGQLTQPPYGQPAQPPPGQPVQPAQPPSGQPMQPIPAQLSQPVSGQSPYPQPPQSPSGQPSQPDSGTSPQPLYGPAASTPDLPRSAPQTWPPETDVPPPGMPAFIPPQPPQQPPQPPQPPTR